MAGTRNPWATARSPSTTSPPTSGVCDHTNTPPAGNTSRSSSSSRKRRSCCVTIKIRAFSRASVRTRSEKASMRPAYASTGSNPRSSEPASAARSTSNVGQPLVADLGQAAAEVQARKQLLGAGDGLGRQHQLGRGQHPGVLDAADRSLRLQLELPEGFQLVAEKLGAHRVPPSRREAIEDSSPETELAPALYQRLPAIPERRQPVHQVIDRVGLSGLEGEGPASQRIG